jgi:hypothetical protein
VARFAQRFAPRDCLLLDAGSGVSFDGKRWAAAAGGARRLTAAGAVEEAYAP